MSERIKQEVKHGVEPRPVQDQKSGQGLVEELKELFFREAKRNAWYSARIKKKLFDRAEVIAEVYDIIAYSKYYSSQRERQKKLLELINNLDDATLSEWQEEVYEMWDEEVQ